MSTVSTLRDAFIGALSTLGVSAYYRHTVRNRGPLIRVLVFHDVADASWFDGVLRHIQDEYHVVGPQDFETGTFHKQKINILVTFDDGYASWVHTCLPILKKWNIEALFFINSGLIDAHSDTEKQGAYVKERLLLSPKETLSWDGVRELVKEGHTLGGHTVSHARLSKLIPSLVETEITRDKERIEAETRATLTSFAYPFGNESDYTEETIEVVKRAGYRTAYTTEGVFAQVSNPYRISRMCIESGQSIFSLRLWISGGYDVYRTIKKLCVR